MEVNAYAKINLTLEVLGRRADGYHEVRTVLQTVGLADRLHVELAPDLKVSCSVPDLEGEDNLVWRAADTLRRAVGAGKGASIRLEKRIPIGMGLGGGSSDAAATLKALNDLWELDMDDTGLLSIAASLGSDVPFFLRGGTALGQGRGEVITDLPPVPRQWVVLLCPPLLAPETSIDLSHKTARLYSMLSQSDYSDGSLTIRLVNNLKAGQFSAGMLFNVFEQLGPLAFQGFQQRWQDLVRAGAKSVHLSGTGPSLYTTVQSKEECEEILIPLKSKGMKAYGVSTLQPDSALSSS